GRDHHRRARARPLGRPTVGDLLACGERLGNRAAARAVRAQAAARARVASLSLLCYVDSTVAASSSSRKGVLVRTPPAVKRALVRETARARTSLNDVAVGLLAESFAIPYRPTGRKSSLPGSSPVMLLRMPEELHAAIQVEAEQSGETANDVILRALARELDVPFASNRRGKE